VLSKLAYLTLCRSIQLLALLARGDTAKDLEILVLRHQLAVRRPPGDTTRGPGRVVGGQNRTANPAVALPRDGITEHQAAAIVDEGKVGLLCAWWRTL
jgi:hypothetical protein